MKKTAPYLLSLFFMLCANIAFAVNTTDVKEEKKEEKSISEERKARTYNLILIDFLQPITHDKRKLN